MNQTKKIILLIFTIILFSGIYFVSDWYRKKYYPCEKVSSKSAEIQIQCWEQVADNIVKTQGVEKAFSMFSVFLSKDPRFSESCHEYLHHVGHFAYGYYWDHKNGVPITLPKQTSSCGYGFFHGIMAGAMSQGVTIPEAKNFCLYLENNFGNGNSALLNNCYHGIGHGLEYGGVDWNDPKPDIDANIDKCKLIGVGNKYCIYALFGDISARYISEVLAKSDPNFSEHSIEEYPINIFDICILFPDYRSECISSLVYGIKTSKPLKQLLNVAFTLADPLSTPYVIEAIARTYSRKIQADKNLSILSDCESMVGKNYQEACFTGLLIGKMETVEEGGGGDIGNAFCLTEGATLNTRSICFDRLNQLLDDY